MKIGLEAKNKMIQGYTILIRDLENLNLKRLELKRLN